MSFKMSKSGLYSISKGEKCSRLAARAATVSGAEGPAEDQGKVLVVQDAKQDWIWMMEMQQLN